MKIDLVFIGNKFIFNASLREYVFRKINKEFDFIGTVYNFKDGDNSIFLTLDKLLNSKENVIIVTTKQNFSTIGKLISTITQDNQILKDDILMPSCVETFEKGSYLLEYKECKVNVIEVNENQKIANILLLNNVQSMKLEIFNTSINDVYEQITPIARSFDINFSCYTLIDGWVSVKIQTGKYGDFLQFTTTMYTIFEQNIIVASDIIEYMIEKLTLANKKITFAESCTGGLLSYYFTAKNGASNILDGSLVTYSNKIKESWLAVDKDIIMQDGAVSQSVVLEMAEGAINVSSADIAVSISGVAGDGGGTEAKPVGTVYVAIRYGEFHNEVKLNLNGDRNYIQQQSVLHAIKMIIESAKEIFFEI